MVGFKNAVMNQCMTFEGVAKLTQRFVHDIAMQRPFENRGKHHCGGSSNGAPKKECHHQRGEDWDKSYFANKKKGGSKWNLPVKATL